jgi:phosphopantothenate-cysteine ligase
VPFRVVVTGGGTVAPIDDVRRITNTSSGRFSADITEACLELGAEVWHVHARAALLPFVRDAVFDLDSADAKVEIERLLRNQERWLAVRDRLHLVPLRDGTVGDYQKTLHEVITTHSIDIAFLAMAVSDYEPIARTGKLDSRANELIVECHPTPKVIRAVRDWAPAIYLVGFKLLSGVPLPQLVATAEAACRENRADLTVANDWTTVRERRHTILLVRPGEPPESYSDPGAAKHLVERALSWAATRDAARSAPSNVPQ